jgi:hypothetical protein
MVRAERELSENPTTVSAADRLDIGRFAEWSPPASANAVAITFGLTPAATRVLTRVLSGMTVVEAATDLGVAPTSLLPRAERSDGRRKVLRATL